MIRNDVFAIRTQFTDVIRPLTASGHWPDAPIIDVAVARRERELRGYFCRLFGWDDAASGLVDAAVRTLLTAGAHGAAVALRGESDPVPIAYALHRRLLGPERPFIACDPRRHDSPGSVRSPPNRRRGMDALKEAAGGSVCISARRLPKDFDAMAAALRGFGAGVQVFLCLSGTDRIRDLLGRPIEIPSLSRRAADLDRLVTEYLADAAQALGVAGVRLSGCAPNAIAQGIATFAELEKILLRLVAIRSTTSVSQAARRLRIATVSLSRWLHRRRGMAALRNASCLECMDDAGPAPDGQPRADGTEVIDGERRPRTESAPRSTADITGDDHGKTSHISSEDTHGDGRDRRLAGKSHRRVRRVRAAADRSDRA